MSLVERESELGALTALLDGLVAGRSHAALSEGPAGIGKTRLLAATRETAEVDRDRGGHRRAEPSRRSPAQGAVTVAPNPHPDRPKESEWQASC